MFGKGWVDTGKRGGMPQTGRPVYQTGRWSAAAVTEKMHQQDFSKTIRLYYDDSEMKEFTAVVVSCTPLGEEFLVELDRTAFFAEGGGQEGDRGELRICGCSGDENAAGTRCGGPIAVSNTTEKAGIIYHHVSEFIAPGTQVEGAIDWELRYDRMQQHSAEHIVSGLVHKLYGFDNVGFRLTDEKTTLDFNGVLTAGDVTRIERLSNEAIWKNVPFNTLFPTKEEEASIEYRSKISIEGQVRLVEVPGYDLCACCAPHVKSSAQIGVIKIVDMANYKGGVRLTIKCGGRAVKDYDMALASLQELGEELSVPREELGTRVSKLKDELAAAEYEVQRWQAEYLAKCSGENIAGVSLCIVPPVSGDVVRRFVNETAPGSGIAKAVFFGNDTDGYGYVIGSDSGDLRALARSIGESLNGRGGGKDNMIQGTVKASAAQIREFFVNRSEK